MQILENVELASRCTLKVGGRARYFVEAREEAHVVEALAWAAKNKLTVRVLGGGSNLVISDAGVNGLVLSPALTGVSIDSGSDEVELSAAAGENWDELVRVTVERNLQGLECLSGIPGLVGATPIQNVGAYGQDVSQSLITVRTLDRNRLSIVEFNAQDCHFAYRDSLFKSELPERYIVLGVKFRLRRGAPPLIAYAELEKQLTARGLNSPTLQNVRQVVLELRAAKSMLLDANDSNGRSCGSFFVNPIVSVEHAEQIRERVQEPNMPRYPQADGRVKLAAAWLIERAGFSRGMRDGNVGLSSKHALAIVCHAGARASDVRSFARRVQQVVFERFGVELHPEPVFWD